MNRHDFDAYTALRDTARAVPSARVDAAVLASARRAVARQRRNRNIVRAAVAVAAVLAVIGLWTLAGLPLSLVAVRA